MIEGMISRAEFRFNGPVSIAVPSQLSSTTIYLGMRGTHSEQTSFYPISGFPRCLIAEDMINGTFLPMIITFRLLNPKSESRLDKRAELIKERRYGVLAVASDPSIAMSDYDDHALVTITEEAQHKNGKEGEENALARADSAESAPIATTTSTGRTSNSRASSQTLTSQLSGGSSSSTSKAAGQHVSIADLRAQARSVAQEGHANPITIVDGDELAKSMSATLALGSSGVGTGVLGPDFGSDDSDGPPAEGDEEDSE